MGDPWPPGRVRSNSNVRAGFARRCPAWRPATALPPPFGKRAVHLSLALAMLREEIRIKDARMAATAVARARIRARFDLVATPFRCARHLAQVEIRRGY